MGSCRWSNVFLPHTVLHCGYGGGVDRTVMWCSRKEFCVLNSWEMGEMLRNLKSPVHLQTLSTCVKQWTRLDVCGHTLSTVYCIKWPVVHTVGAAIWIVCISTPVNCSKPIKARWLCFMYSITLRSCVRSMVNGSTWFTPHNGKHTHRQWHTHTDSHTKTCGSVSIAKLHLLSCFYILCWIQKPETWDEEKC